MLHRLIHTKLLSGSLEPDLALSGAQRRKALEGRIDELVGASKVGKGETRIRREEHNKAAKSVRDGLKEKRKQKLSKQLEMVSNPNLYKYNGPLMPLRRRRNSEIITRALKLHIQEMKTTRLLVGSAKGD